MAEHVRVLIDQQVILLFQPRLRVAVVRSVPLGAGRVGRVNGEQVVGLELAAEILGADAGFRAFLPYSASPTTAVKPEE